MSFQYLNLKFKFKDFNNMILLNRDTCYLKIIFYYDLGPPNFWCFRGLQLNFVVEYSSKRTCMARQPIIY